MKKIIIYLLSFLIIWINTTFAASSLTKAPTLLKSEAKSLEVTWEKLDSASGYFIYYSENSWKDQKSFWDVFEDNKGTITWLKENTTYYVTVTAIDKTTEEESEFSPEWIFNTKAWDNLQFALEDVVTKSSTEIELTFNKNINQSENTLKEFKITKDNKEVTKIKETKLVENEKNKLLLVLSNPIASWEYKIVAISIIDEEWNNIEEWINWELKFEVWTFENENIEPTTPVISEEEDEVEWWFPAWNPEEETQNYWLAWKNMTGVLSTWEVVAGDAKNLPKTWPEHILLILASLSVGLLFYFRKRKTV